MEIGVAIAAVVMLTVGLIGQAFEMRKMRNTVEPQKVFLHKRNFKWYALIGASIILWYIAAEL